MWWKFLPSIHICQTLLQPLAAQREGLRIWVQIHWIWPRRKNGSGSYLPKIVSRRYLLITKLICSNIESGGGQKMIRFQETGSIEKINISGYDIKENNGSKFDLINEKCLSYTYFPTIHLSVIIYLLNRFISFRKL